MFRAITGLPNDRRSQQGGMLFLVSLVIFFLTSILLYALYAFWRREDPRSELRLPTSFLLSTAFLILISGLLHLATRTVRREQRLLTPLLLLCSGLAAIAFLWIQFVSLDALRLESVAEKGIGTGVLGMVIVLAFLHALHVLGGVISLGIVTVLTLLGRYDHERHWPIDFTAHYWHFLDLVWLCMLATFWATTGGFGI